MTSPPTTREEKESCLKNGLPIKFNPPPQGAEESPESKEGRTLQASWLNQLAEGKERVISVPIEIRNAIIEGPVSLSFARFASVVRMIGCEFLAEVEMLFSVFDHTVNLTDSIFRKPVDLRASEIKYDLRMPTVTFVENARFMDVKAGCLLVASGARFSMKSGIADFERISVGKAAFFRPVQLGDEVRPACFYGNARFFEAEIQGDAEFNGAEFKKNAMFERFKVHGATHFHTFAPREIGSLVPAYLDECRRRGILQVRLIHGKGIGNLQRSVHAILSKRTDVARFSFASAEFGGRGATLVTLRP